MFTIKGKYSEAKVYASIVEDEAMSQIYNFVNSPVTENCKVAIMPDAHAGKGICIGFTQEIKGRVVPNAVSVDIGCGMLVLKVSKDFIMDLPKLDKVIHQKIPSGMNHRDSKHPFADKTHLQDLICPVNRDKLLLSVGSLGSGNHFLEVDTDENGDYYIVIHSGSRHLGIEVAKYYQNKAIEYWMEGGVKFSIGRSKLIQALKSSGRQAEIAEALKKYDEKKVKMPAELAYLEGPLMEDYLHDMKIAQEYAMLNREAMLDVIISEMGIKKRHILDKFCTIHNYIDLDNMILRKGAISLQKDELAIIPGSMQFGSLIVKGKGNKEANFSGPHGFGRLMSRSKAKETLKMEDFKSAMEGIYTTCVSTSTIDEAPMAYKPAESIIPNIEPMCEIISHIHPIYNFKSSEQGGRGNRKIPYFSYDKKKTLHLQRTLFYFIYPHCLLKRKTKEPLERMIENMKNGTIKHPERFPNPRIIEITDSFRKFVERRHSVVIAGNIDYNIWEWQYMEIKVTDHLTELDSAIKSVEEELEKTHEKLEALREQKAKLETENLLKDFEEGEYYRLDDRDGCLSYYFKYSERNFHVHDMTKTVGYTGENDVIISHGLKVFATRTQYQAGFFHALYLPLSCFRNLSVSKIDAEEFKDNCEQVIKYVRRCWHDVQNVQLD